MRGASSLAMVLVVLGAASCRGVVAERPAAKPESPPRLVPTACEQECRPLNGETCVARARGAGEPEVLGCGEVSPSGRYAVLRRRHERGLTYTYIDVDGNELDVDVGSCTELEAYDCDDPGEFLDLEQDGWLHRMGPGGSGTNDQALWNMVTGRRHELPEGEYDVIVHPDRKRIGLFATVPNDPVGGWRTTLACFDVERGMLHRVWTTRLSDAKVGDYHVAELAWDGDALVLVDEGKVLRRAPCPPDPKGHEATTAAEPSARP